MKLDEFKVSVRNKLAEPREPAADSDGSVHWQLIQMPATVVQLVEYWGLKFVQAGP